MKGYRPFFNSLPTRPSRDEKKHRSAERDYWRRQLCISKWLNYLTGGAAIVAFLALLILRSQLNEMQAEQRPWVYVSDIVPGGHIVLSEGKYALPLVTTTTNTGHLPAFYVVPKIRAVVLAVGDSTRNIRNDVCDEYRESVDRDNTGSTIFAGQSVPHQGFTGDDYPAVDKVDWDRIKGEKLLIVFGCVDYQFPDKPGHHQSRFSFAAGESVDQGKLPRIGFLPDDPTKVDIRLFPVGINDGVPAD